MQGRAYVAARESSITQAAPIILTDATEINPGLSPGVVVSFSKECTNLSSVHSFNRPDSSNATAVGDITPTIEKKRAATRTSLPAGVSNPTIPITATSVKHSARLNKQDAFSAVHLDREPAKIEPVSLELLTSWGIDCVLTPSELTTDKLLQTPAPLIPMVNDEDTTEV
jgi:hypothetical protein